MTPPTLYGAAAILLFVLGFAAAVSRPLLVQRLIALNVMGASVFLFLISVAYARPEPFPDPVPHAMVLTGIVVAIAITAFAVGLIRGAPDADPPSGDDAGSEQA